MKTKINLAIIGFGKRGKTHYRNLSNNENVKIVAICDPRKQEIDDKLINWYSDPKEMLSNEKIDAAIISTPTTEHYTVAKYFISAKTPLLLEKPATKTIQEAIDLYELALENETLCFIGYNFRFDSKINKIKQIIDNKEIGRVLMIRGRQSHNWGGAKPFEWSLKKAESGGGTIIDNATHYIDLFQYLIGNISDVYAISNNLGFNSEVEDNAIISIKFSNKVIGVIETSWKDESGRNNSIHIWGDKGVIKFDQTNEGENLDIIKYKSDKDEWNRFQSEKVYIPKGIEQVNKKSNLDNNKNLMAENTKRMLDYFLSLVIDNQEASKYMKKNDFSKNVKIISDIYNNN